MIKLVLFHILLIYFALASQRDKPCPRNEVFSECAQPTVCMTCTSPWRCPTFTCSEGCDCIQGYYRDAQGTCIPRHQCPLPEGKQCPSNEVFSECAQPTACMTCTYPQRCPTFTCNEGCDCTQGYYRNEQGTCIPRQQCPVPFGLCKEDEAYYDAIPNCKNTCEHYGNPGVRCAFGPPGCFCKEGLVKRKDGKCVKFEDCENDENKCPSNNEEYSTCGSHCPLTCDNYNKSVACILSCATGCFCKKGRVRNRNMECVPPSQCESGESVCGKNEQIVPCAKPKWCNTCGIRGNCKLVNCITGCDCKHNHFRNEEGVCVPEKECYVVN